LAFDALRFEGDVAGCERLAMVELSDVATTRSTRRSDAATVKSHQRYPFTHKIAKIQENRKSR